MRLRTKDKINAMLLATQIAGVSMNRNMRVITLRIKASIVALVVE